MAYIEAAAVRANRPALSSSSTGEALSPSFRVLVPTATIAAGDIIGLCKLPARHLPVDLFLDIPQLDTGAVLTFDVGVYEDDQGATPVHTSLYVFNSLKGDVGGVQRADNPGVFSLIPSDVDRIVAMTFTNPASTPVLGELKGWASFRPVGLDD